LQRQDFFGEETGFYPPKGNADAFSKCIKAQRISNISIS